MALSHIRLSNLRNAAFAFLSAAMFAQLATAAPPGPDGNRGHLNRLLHNQELIDYLGLTEEQALSAQTISNEVVESHRAEFEKALEPGEKAERVAFVRGVFISVNEDTFKRLEDVFSTYQHQRLEQIEIQTFGIRALVRPAIVEYLELTPDQADELQKVGEAMGEKLAGIHRSQDLSTDQKKEATAEIRSAAFQDVRQHMSPEQWLKWELLIGAEYNR